MIAKLRETLENDDGNGKRLIILNFYGSHMDFSDRYPPDFANFHSDDSLLDEYDNSVLYTDYIQSEVIKLVSEHDGKYLFFADHGLGDLDGPIPLMHDVRESPSVGSLEVPFFTFPKEDLGLPTDKPLSLFYFECIFSRWSGITAAEIDAAYCDAALSSQGISFIDANLIKRDVHRADLPK